jgi:hypothetical protein
VKLFLVTRWGSDDPPDYANGPDTNFLVRAEDFKQAASLADEQLRRLPNKRACSFANVVVQLGIDGGAAEEARILAGPFIEFCHNKDGYHDSTWIRDPQLETMDWQTLRDRLLE